LAVANATNHDEVTALPSQTLQDLNAAMVTLGQPRVSLKALTGKNALVR
jgi:hypothetical protein